MPSHRAESPTPRRRTDRPDISERRQARAAASPQYATVAPAGIDEVDDVEAHFYAVDGPVRQRAGVLTAPSLAPVLPATAVAPAPRVAPHISGPFPVPAPQPAAPPVPQPQAPSDGYDVFGGTSLLPAPAAAPAVAPRSVVKGGPAQPMTRAQLRAAEGPLTSRAARRQAEKQAGRTSGRPAKQAAVRPQQARAGRPASARPGGRGLSLPQVGVASALGLATIAAPLTGALSVPAPKASTQPLAAVAADAPVAAFPEVGTPEQSSVLAATLVPGLSDSASVPGTLAAPRTIIVTRASRDTERSVLPGCDGIPPTNVSWSNGQLPTKKLCTLWDGKNMLRADAAVALAKLNIAYKKRFGHNVCLTDSYRTLSEQYHLRAIKPGLAAAPGTSNHGWGVAIDMCDRVQDYGSASYRWMRDNAPAYGWENPDWALPGGPGPFEPWHWEYMPGEKIGPGSD